MSPECLSRDAINDKSFFVTFFMCKVSKSYSNPISDTVNPPYETLTYVDLTSWRHKMNLKNLSVPRRYKVVRPVTKWFDDLNLGPKFSRLACRGLKLSRDHPYIYCSSNSGKIFWISCLVFEIWISSCCS